MKNCPFCKNLIQDNAIKCRFCKEWIDPAERNRRLKIATKQCPICGQIIAIDANVCAHCKNPLPAKGIGLHPGSAKIATQKKARGYKQEVSLAPGGQVVQNVTIKKSGSGCFSCCLSIVIFLIIVAVLGFALKLAIFMEIINLIKGLFS